MTQSEKEPLGHKGWYSRDYLPHVDQPGLIQAITYHLHDSMPAELRRMGRDDHDRRPHPAQRPFLAPGIP